MDAYAAHSALMATCDGCGLVQVASGITAPDDAPWEPVGCVLCGCVTGTWVENVPGHWPPDATAELGR